MNNDEALAALEAKVQAERQLGAIAVCPPWRHALFAMLMAGLVATPAIPTSWRMVGYVAILAGTVLIALSDRRRLGVFVNGYRRGKTRLVAFGLLALFLPIYAASCYYGIERHQEAVPIILAMVMGVIAYLASIQWQRVFVSEMGA